MEIVKKEYGFIGIDDGLLELWTSIRGEYTSDEVLDCLIDKKPIPKDDCEELFFYASDLSQAATMVHRNLWQYFDKLQIPWKRIEFGPRDVEPQTEKKLHVAEGNQKTVTTTLRVELKTKKKFDVLKRERGTSASNLIRKLIAEYPYELNDDGPMTYKCMTEIMLDGISESLDLLKLNITALLNAQGLNWMDEGKPEGCPHPRTRVRDLDGWVKGCLKDARNRVEGQ